MKPDVIECTCNPKYPGGWKRFQDPNQSVTHKKKKIKGKKMCSVSKSKPKKPYCLVQNLWNLCDWLPDNYMTKWIMHLLLINHCLVIFHCQLDRAANGLNWKSLLSNCLYWVGGGVFLWWSVLIVNWCTKAPPTVGSTLF